MEYNVIFNAGRDAYRAGVERAAPATIEYPIISRYQAYRKETVTLDNNAQREWLRGWDHQAAL